MISGSFGYVGFTWDKITGPDETFELNKNTDINDICRKINSISRKSYPLALIKYVNKDNANTEWAVLCSPDKYIIYLQHHDNMFTLKKEYVNEKSIKIELANLMKTFNMTKKNELYLYNMGKYETKIKLDRKKSKEGVIYTDDESLERYREQMIERRTLIANQMKAKKSLNKYTDFYKKCSKTIDLVNETVQTYLSNPVKYSMCSVYVNILMMYTFSGSKTVKSLTQYLSIIINYVDSYQAKGYNWAKNLIDENKKEAEKLLIKIIDQINKIKDMYNKI